MMAVSDQTRATLRLDPEKLALTGLPTSLQLGAILLNEYALLDVMMMLVSSNFVVLCLMMIMLLLMGYFRGDGTKTKGLSQ